ncbi:glycosyltransferase [Romboutsia timonensis]|uniref:glycosyltransferase n=1 Tax=Romboutsia timonensis TaxID=1776391 RepID=UPI0008D9A8F1|nr:glycosyltransferase [Romboutsia timonensis]
MRVLVITRSSWSNDNNIGNTMTNLFSGFKDTEFTNIYFREQISNNDIASKTFHITEQQIVSAFIKGTEVGKQVKEYKEEKNIDESLESKIYRNTAIKSNNFMLMIRELMWTLGNWKNSRLDEFLDEYKPDIIFMPVFGCYYPHKVLSYIKNKTKAKVVLFHADDNYTLKQFSLSPLYWMYRIGLRRWVKKSVQISDINYCISELQRIEYEKCFKTKCKILYKGGDFEADPYIKNNTQEVIKLVFTGNISSGRWKTLANIGEALNKINREKIKAQLVIYSHTPMTKRMKKALDIGNSIILMGGVPASEIQDIQQNADILVHVESFDLKERLQVRLSFSTKIVDYFSSGKCIFAVGNKDVESINYLIKNDSAIVATNKSEIFYQLKKIIDNPILINEYSKKSWECGVRNHQINKIQKELYEDLRILCE